MNYNTSEDIYEGLINIDENTISGLWEIDFIVLKDNNNNSKTILNSNKYPTYTDREDFSAGNFTVSGTTADVTPPTIDVSTLKVDKTEATVGESVKVSIKATDEESGIKSINVYYYKPITGDIYDVTMNYNTSEDIYEGLINIDENTISGLWEIDSIVLKDNNNNSKTILNSNKYPTYTDRENFSAGNFTVIEDPDPVIPIEGVSVVTDNKSWSNKTIEGDLYIGPGAVLTVTDTVVKGNVYVIGALKSNGGLSVQGTLYGKQMYLGGNPTIYNGTIIVNGSNSLSSSIMSNYPVKDLPVRIDNSPLKAIDGKLDILGATLDVVDMYIDGNKYDIGYNGKIRIYDLNVVDKDKVTIKFKTVFGNEIVKDYNIEHYVTSPSGKVNKLPVITGADDLTIKVGDSFNPKAGIVVNDDEDGDITSSIVVSGQVDTNKIGDYKLTYSVTDSYESIVTKERTITVRSNEKPVISGATAKNVTVGNVFDAKAGVTAADLEDGSLTTKIAVSGTINTNKVGKYTLTYTVTDSDGNKVSIPRVINVVARNIQVNALIGTDRYDTAVRLSKGQFTTANTVMIANGGALADGLAATPLATFKKAPLLLTGASSLPEGTKGEIKRLGAKNAIIVGGSGVVNDSVIKELKLLGVTNVERIGGRDRYDTSLEIAKYIDKNCYDVNKVVISNGLGQADALSIASVAGRDKMAIVLVQKDVVPTKVYSWLQSESLQNAYIIGGTGVVSDNVLNKVNGITSTNISKNRLGGKDRYATNAMVIDKFYGSVVDKTYIAKGLQLIDALAAGPVAALNGSPVVLSGVDLTTEQKTVLDKRYGNIIIRTGGGIADKAVNSLKSCIAQ
ncbi:MAG: DUF5011 domain-containing protein [Clostridium sulfidigenes]|uniref:DUF5011 domain-containing protein n=1 Tax=Clostridium sulfidigenes TaxID=318464 RepID=A0A927WD56_9CLOT|nr:DUF5011 domain-containing protein [Clostridium sulfidigenes]